MPKRKIENELKEPSTCEYIVDNRLCRAVTDLPEGKDVRKEFCKSSPKNYCCYLCSERESCEISCSYLDSSPIGVNPTTLRVDNSALQRIENEIKTYQEEMDKLSILFANGKIGEQSYLAATKTLERKIGELKEIKENPTPSLISSEPSTELDEFGDKANQGKPSALWYLVPFLFGLIGGIVGYLAVKDENKESANNLLIFGLIWSIILIVIYWLILAALLASL